MDRSSSAELSEAIKSMCQWYGQAGFCIAYRADISIVKDERGIKRKQIWMMIQARMDFAKASGFPKSCILRQKLENHWNKTSVEGLYFPRHSYQHSSSLQGFLKVSVAAKMSGASKRQISRPEDIGYSLLGLLT